MADTVFGSLRIDFGGGDILTLRDIDATVLDLTNAEVVAAHFSFG